MSVTSDEEKMGFGVSLVQNAASAGWEEKWES